MIALLVFGPKRLGEIGKGLGEGIRAFRQGARDDKPAPESKPPDEGNKQAKWRQAARHSAGRLPDRRQRGLSSRWSFHASL